MIRIITASTAEQYQAGGLLFKEYADSLDFTLSFQSFEDELTILPKMYGAPTGALLLVEDDGNFVGAVGLRQIENEFTCEVKRMYIRPGHQGKGIGKNLMEAIIKTAESLQYKIIKLDTLAKMSPAVKLYTSFGFRETKPYNFNPHDDVLYFERPVFQ